MVYVIYLWKRSGGDSMEKGININLSIKQISAVCCEDCKKKIRELVKDQISEDLINQITGPK